MKELTKSIINRRTARYAAALIAATIAASAPRATAQVAPAAAVGADANDPAGQMRFYVDLKDATLADALEMVFKAAGNPAHIVDDSARLVNVANSTFPNHDWHSIVRQLTGIYNFKFYKNDAGTWVIEPRVPPAAANGGFGGEGFPGGFSGSSSPTGNFPRGGSSSGGFPSGRGGGFNRGQQSGSPQGAIVPANPFGSGNRPPVRNFVNPQTAPAFGAGAAGGADAGGEEKTFRILIVKHVYAGGVAALFKEAGLIPTGPFVSPGYSGGGGGGQNGGFGGGGQQGGGGGFGGQQGGGGGFGGGGQQGGGFGGGGGGFGGGGF